MSWVSVGVAGVSAGVSLFKKIKAGNEEKKAEHEAAALRRPFYQIQPEYQQNKNIAEAQASGGFTSGEKQYLEGQRERGLTTSLDTIKQTGASVNQFGALNEVFLDSLKSEAAEDANRHLQNIGLFTNAAKDMAAQKTIQWGVNEKEPFETKLAELQSRRTAAQTNQNNATDELIGSLSAAGTGINSFLKTKAAGVPAPEVDAPVYNRKFGLADTSGGGAGSPAAGFGTIDPNSSSVFAGAPPPSVAGSFASINPNAGTGVIAR